ncbi:hypothetical protein D3C76_1665610 [compost metagenome]
MPFEMPRFLEAPDFEAFPFSEASAWHSALTTFRYALHCQTYLAEKRYSGYRTQPRFQAVLFVHPENHGH